MSDILTPEARAAALASIHARQQSREPTRIAGPIAQFAMDVPPPIDFRPEVKKIADAVAGVKFDAKPIASALKFELIAAAIAKNTDATAALISAVRSIKLQVEATDTSAVVAAIKDNTAALKAAAGCARRDRRLANPSSEAPAG